uniref:Phospholipid/glycerol acyltransferase domain-containing protein n=1 Tax=Megaselia scalaris TaxID=36166 RepID=T1GJG4_MEGSC
MVLFPEGGFLHKRRSVSQRYIEKMNLPPLEYVTLPRVGALKAIFDVMVSQNSPSNEERLGGSAGTNDQNPLLSPSSNNSDLLVTTTNSNHQIDSNLNSNSTSPTNSRTSDLLEYILDITIAYPDRKPVDLPNICLENEALFGF